MQLPASTVYRREGQGQFDKPLEGVVVDMTVSPTSTLYLEVEIGASGGPDHKSRIQLSIPKCDISTILLEAARNIPSLMDDFVESLMISAKQVIADNERMVAEKRASKSP
jgi:hypothetical protein